MWACSDNVSFDYNTMRGSSYIFYQNTLGDLNRILLDVPLMSLWALHLDLADKAKRRALVAAFGHSPAHRSWLFTSFFAGGVRRTWRKFLSNRLLRGTVLDCTKESLSRLLAESKDMRWPMRDEKKSPGMTHRRVNDFLWEEFANTSTIITILEVGV